MLLFDMCEECWIGEVPFSAGASKFAFSLLLILSCLLMILPAFFLAHNMLIKRFISQFDLPPLIAYVNSIEWSKNTLDKNIINLSRDVS
jgi:hypothetical protein